jgi:hypothetical protein
MSQNENTKKLGKNEEMMEISNHFDVGIKSNPINMELLKYCNV